METGMPAVDYIREALMFGAHAITANKGPVLHAYEELSELASKQGRSFLFESTVMDGVPLFSLFRENLPAIEVKGFHGVLNSTTNFVLGEMEAGLTFDEALKRAQQLGIAEENADLDIDGWDAAIKVALLVRVIMGADIRLADIDRQGIRKLSLDEVRSTAKAGKSHKLVCRACREGASVKASVRLEEVPFTDALAWVRGASSVLCFETDVFPGLTITETHPDLNATAYGMLSDFIRAVKSTPPSVTLQN
jgi:homoserine dehydrogenase